MTQIPIQEIQTLRRAGRDGWFDPDDKTGAEAQQKSKAQEILGHSWVSFVVTGKDRSAPARIGGCAPASIAEKPGGCL